MTKTFDQNIGRSIKKAIQAWAGWNLFKYFKIVRTLRNFKKAAQKRNAILLSENLSIPPMIILSVTMKCNLFCDGCYSRKYSLTEEMTFEEIEKIFKEAMEIGIFLFIITGGEPMLRPEVIELMAKYRNLLFLLFTNSTLIDEKKALFYARSSNIIPMLSIEGEQADTGSDAVEASSDSDDADDEAGSKAASIRKTARENP